MDRQPSHDKLSEFIQSLEDGKAVGLDGISPKLLHIGATALAPGLIRILNLSINTGFFLEKWKIAKVVPTHKKGSLQDRENFKTNINIIYSIKIN